MFLPFGSSAQITLENEIPVALRSITSLTVGAKLIPLFETTDSCVIYNVDLTPYRTLHYPAPPAGYTWNSPTYITQSLFDMDPGNIEYLLTGSDGAGSSLVLIGREDGTTVFSTPGLCLGVYAGDVSASFGIFQTENGAKMLINSSPTSATKVFSLPGTVPCVASCQPAATNYITGGVSEGMLPENGQRAFPNPTSERITIPYALPPEETQAILLLRDAAGRVVLERRLNGSGTYELETGQLPNGVYPYTIMGANGVLTSSRIVVMR